MATVTEIRAKLRAGEVVVMSTSSLFIFMRECERHPQGTERYSIKPHTRGYSMVYDPERVNNTAGVEAE